MDDGTSVAQRACCSCSRRAARRAACTGGEYLPPAAAPLAHAFVYVRNILTPLLRSVATTPSIQVSPHNVVITFKKVEERLWEALPGTQSHFAHTLDGDSRCGYTVEGCVKRHLHTRGVCRRGVQEGCVGASAEGCVEEAPTHPSTSGEHRRLCTSQKQPEFRVQGSVLRV